MHKNSRLCGQIGEGQRVSFNGSVNLPSDNSIVLSRKALKNFVKLYTLISERKFQDVKQMIIYYKDDLNELFTKLLLSDINIKVQLCFQILFEKNLDIDEYGERRVRPKRDVTLQ
jgi:hypothetical protein